MSEAIEQEIRQRQERLQEIRRKAFAAKIADGNHVMVVESTATEQLDAPDKLLENVRPIGRRNVPKVVLKSADEIIKEELAALATEETNLAPKKINWDLKNQIEDRLEKLRRRTQRAVVELLREKLAAQDDE